MDRQEAKPNRPSLLSGAESRPASGRILADMENRQGRPAVAKLRRVRPLFLLLGAAVIGLLAGYWLLGNRDASLDTEPTRTLVRSPEMTTPTLAQPAAAIETTTGLAVSPAPGATIITSEGAHEGEIDADPFAALTTTPARAGKAVASARKRTPVRGKKPAGGGGNDSLSATLLRNIKQKQNAQDALDTLMQQISTQNAATTRAAAVPGTTRSSPASAARTTTPTRSNTESAAPIGPQKMMPLSQQIQASLGKCAPANTTQGLQCRLKICAKFTGQDPACPRR